MKFKYKDRKKGYREKDERQRERMKKERANEFCIWRD
jgi:hypothetical protein